MILIFILFSILVMYKINNALLRMEIKQDALGYNIYILDKDVRKEENLLLQKI